MPYFWWQGTTITGELFSGYVFAPSTDYLAKQLFKQQLALIKTKDYSFYMYFYTITYTDKAELYEQLATLLQNGVQLSSACALIAQQSPNPKIQQIFFTCSAEIEAGNSINRVLAKQSTFFDTLACQTIAVGLETGTLVTVCTLLSNYYQTQATFKAKMRSILLTPIITAVFIFLVALGLFIFFIPKLSSLFATLNVAIPPSTQLLINMSNFVRSMAMLYATAIFIGVTVACCILKKYSFFMQKIIETVCYNIPFVRLIIVANAQATFFSFLSTLLASNIPLAQSLSIIVQVLPAGAFHTAVDSLNQQVQAGKTLAAAMNTQLTFFSPHHVAVVAIAQETACLPVAIDNMAKKALQKIDNIIGQIIFWTGPLLLLLLGMCVAGLMVAMYSPLINLSYGLR